MSKNKSTLTIAQEQVEMAIQKLNEKITELGVHTSYLFDELKTLQNLFEQISNVPNENKLEFNKLKTICLEWKLQAQKIESEYRNATAKNAGKGVAGAGFGIAVVAFGPTAAMGVATTFGVASTGTAISTLTGATATNAALAWLGGGAIAAKGGGMAAGKILLGLAGPVGWTIVGAALLSSGFIHWKGKKDKGKIEEIFIAISKRDIRFYELAIIELNERIIRMMDENKRLKRSIQRTREFGMDYNTMTEAQQYELGAFVNLMNSSTQLLVNPITGLQPKYDMNDLEEYLTFREIKVDDNQTKLIVSLSNLLYKIDVDEKDNKRLWKTFKRNEEFLDSVEISKEEFEFSIFDTVTDALNHKYSSTIV